MNKEKYCTHKRLPFFELARPYILEDSKVLDIGAGNAAFSDYYKRNDFYLFDANQGAVKSLKENHINVFYGQLPNLPFKENYFDVIHCSHVVEHLEPQVLYDSLIEMDRCLKPDGYLIISAPLMWSGFFNDLSHVKPYPPIVFKNYLCSKNKDPRTRPLISSTYSIASLTYRYRKLSQVKEYNNLKRNFVGFFIRVYNKLLKTANINELEKTGYTIILKK